MYVRWRWGRRGRTFLSSEQQQQQQQPSSPLQIKTIKNKNRKQQACGCVGVYEE